MLVLHIIRIWCNVTPKTLIVYLVLIIFRYWGNVSLTIFTLFIFHIIRTWCNVTPKKLIECKQFWSYFGTGGNDTPTNSQCSYFILWEPGVMLLQRVVFQDSHRTVFTFRSWLDLLGVVLAFWISILKISKLLQNYWHRVIDITSLMECIWFWSYFGPGGNVTPTNSQCTFFIL